MGKQRWISILHYILLLIIMGLQSSCTDNKPYRTDTTSCVSKGAEAIIDECAANSVQQFVPEGDEKGDYMLGFVEFDDQGQIHDYQQMVAVRDLLQGILRRGEVIVMVFVHGWKHDAHAGPESGEEDNNITRFREVLSSVSRTESLQNPDAPRKVVGIYLGWRGMSVTLPWIKELTFWERKNTAHKVGGGAITEVLLTLDNLLSSSENPQMDGGNKTKSRFIVVGHSFGGAAVYSAVNQILLDRYMSAGCLEGSDCSVKGFGDLVVLMNPAFEAMRYSTLRNAADRTKNFANVQLPLLAVLTSEKDYATRYAFWVGRAVSTLFEEERSERDQKTKNRTAIGHYGPYQTHRLDPVLGEIGKSKTSTLSAQLETFVKFSEQWEKPEQTDFELPEIGVRLTKIGDTSKFDPYLSIYVDGDLIPDHNEIYDPRVTEFLRQLIMLSIQEEDPKIRAMQRSTMQRGIEGLKMQ